jgi:hypothetical protein
MTWLMMAVESPYVAAIIARLPDAAYNLAAYGVAFALAWIVESPIMMLTSAATRMVHDRQSFVALRLFANRLCIAVTLLMIIAVLPPVFDLAANDIMQLPPEVARYAHTATAVLVPWPAAIGYRRFYQGVLVRHGLTRRVAYGTVLRITSMSLTAAILAFTTHLHGSTIGSLALAAGVIAEAAASRWMARHVVRDLLARDDSASGPILTPREITRFYIPLALTSLISMALAPLLTFFMGHGRLPIESLAVLPVVQGVLFVFKSGGVAYQDAGIALSGRHHEHEREVGRAAIIIGACSSLALALLLFTPLASLWFSQVAGLSPALMSLAISSAKLMVALPALEYLLSFQRSRFILNGQTRVITIATMIEIGGIALVLYVGIAHLAMVGAIAASVAIMAGRIAANGFLGGATRRSTTLSPAVA